MKLDPQDLNVSSFDTLYEGEEGPDTIGWNHPTPMTRCFDCPSPTIVPVQPATTVVAA